MSVAGASLVTKGRAVRQHPRPWPTPLGGADVAQRSWIFGELDRLLPKIDFDGPGGCWLWTASQTSKGYGQIKRMDQRKPMPAHRAVWLAVVGPIPDGLTLDHLCRVRLCVNPDHLEPVTNRENILRGESMSAIHARKTHCPRGHPYDVVKKDGSRRCRKCHADRERQRRVSA